MLTSFRMSDTIVVNKQLNKKCKLFIEAKGEYYDRNKKCFKENREESHTR